MRDLLPMSLGDVFDEAFDLYKRNFALFAGIVAAIHVPTMIVWNALYYGMGIQRLEQTGSSSDSETYAALGVMTVYLLAMMAYTFIAVVQNGALAVAISDRYLGRPATLGSAYRRTFAFLFRLLATWSMIFTLWFVSMIVFFVGLMFILSLVAMAMGPASGGVAAILISILFMAGSIAIILLLLVLFGVFITQAIVIEGQGYLLAIRRNLQLVSGRFFHIFGASALMLLINGALLLTMLISLEWVLEGFIYPWFNPSYITRIVIDEVCSTVVWMFLQPFWMTCLTLLYYDQRVRREGFDLELLGRQVYPRAVPEARG